MGHFWLNKLGSDSPPSVADELNGDDDVIKRLRQSNHVSAYGPGSALQPPPPVSVSENQPPGHPPPPHPTSDLASYMWPSAATAAAAANSQPQQQQQQHSPQHNKWSPPGAPAGSGHGGSVKEEPKPNMNQQAAVAAAGGGGDLGQQAPGSPQQEVCTRSEAQNDTCAHVTSVSPVQFQYTTPTGDAGFPSVTSNSATSELYDTNIMSQVQNYSPSLSSSLGESTMAFSLLSQPLYVVAHNFL